MAVSEIELTRIQSSPMRLGMSFFLASESFLFASLFWTYYYLRALAPQWPIHHPASVLAAFNTVLLLASSGTVWLGARAIRKGNGKGLSIGLMATAILGAAFLIITFWEWAHEDFRPWTDAYGSIFYTLTGFHALHVSGGVVLMLVLFSRAARNRFSADNHATVEAGSMYWHFVDVVWLLVFSTIFIIR
jgi:cytochrome c oxidase subunit 3